MNRQIPSDIHWSGTSGTVSMDIESTEAGRTYLRELYGLKVHVTEEKIDNWKVEIGE